MLPLGEFCRAHGIRGEIKLSTNLPPKFFSEVSVVFYGGKEYVVESLRAVNGGALIKLQGIDTPEAANALRGAAYLPDSSKPELDRDEFFWDDVIGLKCVLTDGKEIGKVFEVSLTAPTPVISVRRSSGVSGGTGGSRKATSQDILFPAIKGLIKDVALGDGILLLDAETFSRVAVYED
ncbi:MAG TPA: 16S rRNA processing protein RimM [Candidatus Stercoripulliclostridium merdigallinarum]|uniref:Ribosome maturation factor RimM n=1 Tax=Candidatus Stercoripulliclostridium merdigallinarum TaxID=2840951 RepID=A0A9D1MG84_9FIRM|nr:16S rRNA processing protein RimM [Candidatus Stercoripulliclostridium merdigallinarum]